jgi:hypothetical protein
VKLAGFVVRAVVSCARTQPEYKPSNPQAAAVLGRLVAAFGSSGQVRKVTRPA